MKTFLRGAGAMAAALVLIYLVSSLFPVVTYPPARVAGIVRDYAPGDLVTLSIEQTVKLSNRLGWDFLKHAALRSLSAGTHLFALAIGGIAALSVNRPREPKARSRRGLWTGGFLALSGMVLAVTSPERLSFLSVITYFVASLLFTFISTLAPLSAATRRRPETDGEPGEDWGTRSRRRFLRRGAGAIAVGAIGALVVGRFVGRRDKPAVHIAESDVRFKRPPSDPNFDNLRGLTPEITSNEDFYVVDINIQKPVVDHEKWRLKVHGLVDRPFELTYRQLQTEYEVVEMASTLTCISNEVGGDLISTAVWRGVRLRDVLARAGVATGVVELIFRGAERYSDSIDLDKGLEESTLIAFGMNGESLSIDHGFPARIVVPGIFGMKNVKWLTEIEATDRNYQGYWQTRGWSDSAPVLTQSRVDVPTRNDTAGSPLTAGGIAWAGNRGISKVEISENGGRTWKQAMLKRELSPNSWRLWAAELNTGSGRRQILVRATDGTGSVQQSKKTRTHPNGASGLHSVRFTTQAGLTSSRKNPERSGPVRSFYLGPRAVAS